jgi:hypothetical protein
LSQYDSKLPAQLVAEVSGHRSRCLSGVGGSNWASIAVLSTKCSAFRLFRPVSCNLACVSFSLPLTNLIDIVCYSVPAYSHGWGTGTGFCKSGAGKRELRTCGASCRIVAKLTDRFLVVGADQCRSLQRQAVPISACRACAPCAMFCVNDLTEHPIGNLAVRLQC